MVTNEFERDLNDQAGLKRPGRVDLVVLQNTADAGDGHPGLQRCFRNYLHEGGMEKDLDIHNYKIINLAEPTLASDGARKSNVDAVQADLDGFQDELKDLTQVEIQQLENIGDKTISNAQWGYLGVLNQNLRQADSPTFNSPIFSGLTVNGSITITGSVDGVDVSAHDHSGAGQGGTVSYVNLSNRSHILSGGDHTASGLITGYVIRATGATTFAWQQLAHGDLSGIGNNAHSVIDTHLSATGNPHSVGLSQAFAVDKKILEANSLANAFEVGGSGRTVRIYEDGLQAVITNNSGVLQIKGNTTLIIHAENSTAYGFNIGNEDNTNNMMTIWQNNSTTSAEKGLIGKDSYNSILPFKEIYSYNFFKDASGNYGSYDFVDDLQLLREMHNSENNIKHPFDHMKNKKFKDAKLTSLDIRSLPWVKAFPETEKMTDEELKYAFSDGHDIGYILSALQKILRRQDKIGEIQTDLLKRLKKVE